jgi:hypothetical protein
MAAALLIRSSMAIDVLHPFRNTGETFEIRWNAGKSRVERTKHVGDRLPKMRKTSPIPQPSDWLGRIVRRINSAFLD